MRWSALANFQGRCIWANGPWRGSRGRWTAGLRRELRSERAARRRQRRGALMSDMLDAALKLSARGFALFPCRTKSKEPATKHGHKDATRDAEQIRAWWATCPEYNIGLACAASGVVVIDVDPRNGGETAMQALLAHLGPLPETVTASTGGGGWHLFFRAPSGVEFVGKLGEGVDIKHKGYTLASPSIHPNSTPYRWCASPFERAIADLPSSWLAAATKPAAPAQPARPAASSTFAATNCTPYGRAAVAEELERVRTAPPGTRNNTLNEAACKLAGLHAGGEIGEVSSDLVAAAVAAGLPEQEARRTVESGWKAGLQHLRCAPKQTHATLSAADVSTFVHAADPRPLQKQGAASCQVPPLAAARAVEIWATPLPQPIPTPFSPLDDLLGGGLRGVNLLAGPTGRGKSGLGLQLARKASALRPVLYASTELSERQALARTAAQVIGQPWRRLFEGDATTGQAVASALLPLKLRVVVVTSVTQLLEVLDRIAQHEGRPPFLVLDYLQGLARNPDGDRRLAVGALSEAITTWSRTTDGAALVVSSISRANYLGADAKNAADFVNAAKESGDVEYDASSVLFLDVPAPPLGGTSEGRLHVAKSRFGTVGTVGVIFDGPTGVFSYNPQGSLTEEQAAVFGAIRGGATSQGAIASRCCLRKATVGSVVKALLARQLIGTNPLRALDVQIDKVALAGRFAEQFDARSPGTVPGSFPSVPDALFSREKLVPDPGTNPVGETLVPPL
jgi:hypothetical protein